MSRAMTTPGYPARGVHSVYATSALVSAAQVFRDTLHDEHTFPSGSCYSVVRSDVGETTCRVHSTISHRSARRGRLREDRRQRICRVLRNTHGLRCHCGS